MYGGCGKVNHLNEAIVSLVHILVCGRTLSCRRRHYQLARFSTFSVLLPSQSPWLILNKILLEWKKKIIYIYIYMKIINANFISIHHHYHVVLPARIFLTLSRHFSLSFIASCRSLGLHPISSHSCCMYVRAGHPAFARPYASPAVSCKSGSSNLYSFHDGR